jgi:chemotaxis protein MotB
MRTCYPVIERQLVVPPGREHKAMARKIRKIFEADDEGDSAVTHSSWAVSYADMVTLLLCFFIMFFNVDKKDVPPAKKENMLLSISKQFQKFTHNEKTSSQGSQKPESTKTGGPSVAGGNVGHSSDFVAVLDHLKTIPNAKIIETQDNLELQLANVEFFAKGSTKLTSSGKSNVKLVYSVLKPYRDKVFIEIIGHSDSMPVSNKAALMLKRKFSTNLELSTLRAMEVFVFMKGLGMVPGNIVISGYSDSKPIGADGFLSALDSIQRRVSFRIRIK